MENKGFRNMIKKGLMQFIPIAVGVYVGILAGNWNDNRKTKQQVGVFLENVVKELENNKKRIEWSINYHTDLRNEVDSLFNIMDPNIVDGEFFENGGFQMLNKWTGSGIASLSNSTYTTGVNSNLISSLPFKTSQVLSVTYSSLENYKNFTDPLMTRMLYELDYDTKTKDLMFVWEMLCSDVLAYEERIKIRLGEAIEKLEKL